MPMPRRIPKRGFKAPNRVEAHPINVSQLEQLFDAGATVDLAALQAKGVVPKLVVKVKILGEGNITKKLTIKAQGVSESARSKIEAAGGTIEITE
jgi:large subunit ribosomal protein L15